MKSLFYPFDFLTLAPFTLIFTCATQELYFGA